MATEAEELKSQEEQEGLEEWQPVASTMVAEVSYSEGELFVIFNSGSEQSYPATQAEFEELLKAPSIGKWMWENYPDELQRGRAEAE